MLKGLSLSCLLFLNLYEIDILYFSNYTLGEEQDNLNRLFRRTH